MSLQSMDVGRGRVAGPSVGRRETVVVVAADRLTRLESI